MHLSLLSLLIALLSLPEPCWAARELGKGVRAFSYSYSGMQSPQGITVWQTPDGKNMMQARHQDREYRREINSWALTQFASLAERHHIAAWVKHRDTPLPDGIYVLDGSHYSLEVLWNSGQRLSLFGISMPEGGRAFMDEFTKLWDEIVQRYPYEAPTEIRSDSIREFTFYEYPRADENSWLILRVDEGGAHAIVRVCRGKMAENKDYYKVDPLFLKRLDALIKRHKPYLWHDKAKAASAKKGNDKAIPYASLLVKYHCSPEKNVFWSQNPFRQKSEPDTENELNNFHIPDCDEIIEVIFPPERWRNYEQWKKEVLALFEEAEKGEKYSY